MKTLKEFIKESINESLLDGEDAIFDGIKNQIDFMAKYVTLKDCLDGCVTNSLQRTLGPTHHKIAEYSKLFKKKYKASSPILDRNGKKLNPSVLGDIIAGAAAQVKINWQLPPQERLEKALSELKELIRSTTFPEIEKYENIENFDPKEYRGRHSLLDTDTHRVNVDAGKQFIISRSPKYGYKVLKTKGGVVGKIEIDYGKHTRYESDGEKWEWFADFGWSGYYSVNILDSSPIMVDIDSL